MEILEYNVLKHQAYVHSVENIKPSVQEMQQWVGSLNRRRSLSLTVGAESSTPAESSFRELERRYDLRDVWGHNTTPSMQTLECIQKVKQALVEGAASDDSISAGTFSVLVFVSVVAALAIIIVWELYLRPRQSASLTPLQ